MRKRKREDHRKFRELIGGEVKSNLKKFVGTGRILRLRPNGKGTMSVPVPYIDTPYIRHGKPDEGVGRGPGDKNKIIDREYEPGYGPNAGDGASEGMMVDVDMSDVIKAMEEDMKLPRLKKKDSQTFEKTIIKYTNISRTGSKSLVHKRRTIKQALRRSIASGTFGKKILIPGAQFPVPLLELNNDDFRFRQWNEVKIPRAKALNVFGRDGSYSMNKFKCDIASDLAWWLDLWISRDYEQTEKLFLWHDAEAKEVSEHDFYRLRMGGGTVCSTVLKKLQHIIKHRYPPEQWNIYFWYFGDGENFEKDNKVFGDMLLKLQPVVNRVGIVQIFADNWDRSLKQFLDELNHDEVYEPGFLRTVAIGGNQGEEDEEGFGNDSSGYGEEMERDEKTEAEMRRALIDLLKEVDEEKPVMAGMGI